MNNAYAAGLWAFPNPRRNRRLHGNATVRQQIQLARPCLG